MPYVEFDFLLFDLFRLALFDLGPFTPVIRGIILEGSDNIRGRWLDSFLLGPFRRRFLRAFHRGMKYLEMLCQFGQLGGYCQTVSALSSCNVGHSGYLQPPGSLQALST